MRQGWWSRGLILSGLLLLAVPMRSAQADIVLKVLVVNPSETEVKAFTIHSALPPEIKAEDVLDADGLDVEYDSQAGTFFLTGNVTLKPKESITKHVVLEDVWAIPKERFTDLRQETWALLAKLRGTMYEEQGKLLSASVSRRLAAVEVSQEQPFVNPEQHISLYRENLKSLESIETELVSLRQLMVMAAVAPVAESLLNTPSPATDHRGSGSLSILTTWRVIFLILALLGFVSLSFFLVWQRQLQMQLSKQTTQEPASGDAAGDLFVKNGNGQSAAGAQSPPPIASPAHPSVNPGRAGLQPKSPSTP